VVDVEAAHAGYVFRFAEDGSRLPVGATLGWVLPANDPAHAETLRAEARQSAAVTGGPTISAKARAAMTRSGLSEADFVGFAVVREADVEAKAQELANAHADDDPRIAGLERAANALLIYGTGSQGVTVLDAIEAGAPFSVVGFLDYAPRTETLAGFPVFHTRHLAALAAKGFNAIHICLPDHAQDTRIAAALLADGFELVSVAHPTASIAPTARFGASCFFGAQTILGPEAVLGDRVRLLNGSSVAHHCKVGDGTRITDGARLAGTVSTGRDCLFGLNATVNLRLNIGDRVTVVSGAHVYEHVPNDHVVRLDGKAYPLRH